MVQKENERRLLCLGILFAAETKYLRAPFDDGLEEKQYQDEYGYSPSNGSHMQLTHGRGRLPQSEL